MDLERIWDDLGGALDTHLFTLGNTSVSVASVGVFVATLVVFVLAATQSRRVTARWLDRRNLIDPGLRYALARAVQYVIVSLGAVIAFQFIGVDFTRLGLLLGFLSVGIGFGLQNVTSNFISGLILLIERPVTDGDRVTVGETEGDIVAINMRSTVVRSLQNVSIIVPNSALVTANVVNWSHSDPRIRLPIPVGVAYGSDIDVVLAALAEVGHEHPRVLNDPPPHVRLNGFGDSAWEMELLVWLNEPNEYRDIRSALNIAIVRKFRERGIEIPFPQRDLHLRSPLPLPLQQEPIPD